MIKSKYIERNHWREQRLIQDTIHRANSVKLKVRISDWITTDNQPMKSDWISAMAYANVICASDCSLMVQYLHSFPYKFPCVSTILVLC